MIVKVEIFLAVVVLACLSVVSDSRGQEPEAMPGRVGRGQLIGFGQPLQTVDLATAMGADSGTLMFWFSPQDWDNRLVYRVNENSETVPLVRGMYRPAAGEDLQDLFQFGIYRMSENKANSLWVRSPVMPGTWYHVIVVWDHGKTRVLVNGGEADDWVFRSWFAGKVPAEATLERLELGHQSWMRGTARKLPGHFSTGQTAIDEIRVYNRALTPPELMNAYRRYLPGAELEKLTPVYCQFDLNQPQQRLTTNIEFLDATRDRVHAARLVLTDAAGAVRLDRRVEPVTDGKAWDQSKVTGELYGDFVVDVTWFDAAGEQLGTQRVPLAHPAPVWYGNTLGLHPGEVLPGWAPIRQEGSVLQLLDKEVEIDARGWPSRLTGAGAAVQTAPVRLRLASAAGAIDLQPDGDAATVLSAAADHVVMQGRASGGGWQLTTTTDTAFDGMILLTAKLEGPADQSVTNFQVEIPLGVDHDPMVGFWAGDPWFRSACDYRAMPTKQGVIFASNATGRKQPEGWAGRVSFLPYLAVSDSERGLCWLAENDQNWSQSAELPAQEIVRDGDQLWLRLNLVHAGEPMAMDGPREYRFCLQTTPVRPPSMINRALANQFHFAMVDGFNGNLITAAMGSHQEFRLSPKEGDWEGAAARAVGARRAAPTGKVLLYLDHTWQRAPEDAQEYQADWRGWGGAVAYTQNVQDCLAWYQHEYIRRGITDGFYIDDCWIKPTKSHAPSYRRGEQREWGFDFLGFRDSLMRLRWLFHDQGKEPRIVVHVTQTLYYPLFVFTDVLVDGEDRFPPWGLKRDFIDRWGLTRLRYSSATTSGLPTVYMNAIGNKTDSPGPMGNWVFREARSFVGLCALNDVGSIDDMTGGYVRSLHAEGVRSPEARFTGYWDPANPIRPAADSGILASIYELPDRLVVVLLNTGTGEAIGEVPVDVSEIRRRLGATTIEVTDADPFDPPTGQDVTETRQDALTMQPADPNRTLESSETADTLEMLENLQTDVADEAAEAAKPFPELTDHNAILADDILRLRIRARDYRLLIIRKVD